MKVQYNIKEGVEDFEYMVDLSAEFRLTWMLDLPSHVEGLPETHSTEE
jgi:hypothetical protein